MLGGSIVLHARVTVENPGHFITAQTKHVEKVSCSKSALNPKEPEISLG